MPWITGKIQGMMGYGDVWTNIGEPKWYDIYGNNVEYWSIGIKLAKSNSKIISRWESQFKEQLFVHAKNVLKSKVAGFIPDIEDVEKDIELDKELDVDTTMDDLAYY